MSARCDLTDLLVEQCAHCRGHDDRDVIDFDTIRVSVEMTARLDGRCALDPAHRVEAGDRIGRCEDGWICSGCLARSRPAR